MVLIVRVLIAVPKNHSIGLWINAVIAAGVRDVCKYVSMYVSKYVCMPNMKGANTYGIPAFSFTELVLS